MKWGVSFSPNRRRLLIGGALGAVTLATLGLGRLWSGGRDRRNGASRRPLNAEELLTVVTFIGALFGRELSPPNIEELSDRLMFRLNLDAGFIEECGVLSQYLERRARSRFAAAFIACDSSQKDALVQEFMAINPNGMLSKLMRRISTRERDFYRMRWSTAWQLCWIFSQSGVAWRARGYARWPGVPGDYREILVAGAAYP